MLRRAPWLSAVLLAAGCTERTPETPASEQPSTEVAVPPVDPYTQPFFKAVTEEAGPDQQPPVERTVAGKSTAVLRDSVEHVWPSIELVDKNRRPLPWVVTLETDAGDIEIALRPELAPNHVRNFIALVKVGYYDGLHFDRLVRQEAESQDGVKSEIHLVRFGCPAGTGDPGIGHIGYRMRSEFTDEKHGIGTVGFTRDADPSSAGTRLYITLAPAPVLDGNYTVVGRVSKGIPAVVTVANGKLLPPETDPGREQPERPVVIRRATAAVKP